MSLYQPLIEQISHDPIDWGKAISVQLPTDYPRSTQETTSYQILEWPLPYHVVQKLEEIGRIEQISSSIAVFAVFQLLLMRYSGQDEYVVETKLTRSTSALTAISCRGNPSFREWLSQVKKMVLASVEISEEMEKFVSLRTIQFANYLDNHEETTGFHPSELKLSFYHKGNDWYTRFSYNTSLFLEETIQRMGQHLTRLMEGVIAEPDRPIHTYPILTNKEEQLFKDWNQTGVTISDERSVDQWIATWAKQTPDSLAVMDHRQHLTYSDLEWRANQLAHYLQRNGVQPGDLVAICLERSCDSIVSLLAVFKVGAAYVPIDPAYPTERITYMLQDSQVATVLTDSNISEKIMFPADQVILLDRDQSVIAEMSGEPISLVESPNQVSYLIYTSGSTGQPKGVMITHRSLLNLVWWHLREYQLTSADRTSHLAGPAFDASVWEIWPTLVAGATLCIPDEEKRFSPLDLQNWLIDQQITVSFLPTPLLERVLTLDWPKLVELRTLLTGGDQLRLNPPADFPVEVVNHYGPTENTVVTTAFRLSKERNEPNFPPIGRPIDNTEVYVLDRNLQPVPLGVPGELYVGGMGLSQGYFRRPELTADRFIPHPFSDDPSAKLYRTGDEVRWLPDGNLAFIGRLDDQVKIRGFRVELGEIEQVICQHEQVQHAVVLAQEGQQGDKQLIAYLQLKQSADIDWRSYLSRKLPDYMVPVAFIVLDSFPLTPNGKVDRRALPIPQLNPSTYVPPQTPTEEKVATIWQEVLSKEPIGREDHFLALGGHSLLAAQIISRLNQAFSLKLPFSLLIEVGTVQRLAEIIDQEKSDTVAEPFPLCPQQIEGDQLPMSFAQQRLWFLQRLRPDLTAYHIPFLLRLKGRVDVVALKKSVDQLVDRHQQLRTVFSEVEGQAVQIVMEKMEVGWSIQDFRKSPSPEKAAERWIEQEAATPFDLKHGPLLRCHLLQVGQDDWFFLLHMHHMISDGWSMGVILTELWQCYVAYHRGEELSLPEQPLQYKDFTLWQQKWCKKATMREQIAYWKQKLADVPVLQLPTDKPRPPAQTYAGDIYELQIPEDLVQRLKQLGQREDSTLFMTLLAAFQVLLHRYTGQQDLAVGSPVAGRNHPDLEEIIGFFVNTLVLRNQITGSLSFREFLQQVRQTTLEAFAHQDVAFDQLVTQLQPDRKLSHSPLFQVMFGFQELPEPQERVADLKIETIGLKQKTAKFDLTLMLYQKPDRLVAAFEYNTDLFRNATIQRMADNYLTLLSSIVKQPDYPVGQLPLLSDMERRQLASWNDTTVSTAATCIHRLIEQQVESTPERVAIRYENLSLRYRELNERANQLAHYLQKLGVEQGTFVGVCLERSPEMLIALLAILKAGAAYVPLDPQYPTSRLSYMLTDSKPKVLITEEKWLGTLPEVAMTVVCIDRDQSFIRRESKGNPSSSVQPSDLAYLIYTSGSTGKPKGVMIEHQSVVILIGWAQRIFSPAEREGVLASTSICFDLSVFEMFVPLSSGGSVILASNALELPDLPARDRVTLVNTVPSAAKELIKMNGFPSSVKVINLAGEPLPLTLVQQLYQGSSVEKVYNLYGPSEDTTYSTYALIKRDDLRKPAIGKPLDHTQLYVLDPCLQPVPIGVPGELYIGGAGLARGYLNKPMLTAERFLPSHLEGKESVVYKTGDLVRYREDGMLEFLGRTDHQVKIRGFRIELGEIEQHLRQHPAVSEVVVVAYEEKQTEKRLIAYLVLNQKQEPTVGEWHQYLKEKLPDYMIPAAFMILKEMPLTPNGKVDRKKLPPPTWVRSQLGRKYVPPRSKVEKCLAEIWSQVLRVPKVGVYDQFFELGGDSILTLQVIAKASKEGIYLTPKHFFDYQSIAELAKVAEEKEMAIEAEQGMVSGEVPLTPIQHWFFEQHIPNRHNWNQSVLLRLQSDVELTLLELAFRDLLKHHDGLRLRFSKQGDTWRQWYDSAPSEQSLMRIKTIHVSPAEQQTVLEKHWEQIEEQLHLEKGPLLQAEVIQFADDQPRYLLIAIHHLVVDGVSWRILLEDLQTIYEQRLRKQPVSLARKTTSYQEWANRLQREVHTAKYTEEIEYWSQQLSSHRFPLPVDRSEEQVKSQAVSQVVTTLSTKETEQLVKRIPNQFRAKLPEIFLTVLLKTFAEWTKRRALLVDVEGHGRDSLLEGVDLTRTVGWFTTLYPLFLQLGSTRSWMEEVARVKEQFRRVPQKGSGYGQLRYLADEPIRQSMKQIGKAEISFNYLGHFDQLVSESSCFNQLLEFRGPSKTQPSTHLINLSMMINRGQLQMIWIYDQSKYKSSTIQRLAHRYVGWLRKLMEEHELNGVRATQLAPSDFARANLNRGELKKVLNKLRKRAKK